MTSTRRTLSASSVLVAPRKAVKYFRRKTYIIERMVVLALLKRIGLYEYCHIIPARSSAIPFRHQQALRKLRHDVFAVPNISGFYHGILRDFWEAYGLGERCLLISETVPTRQVFASKYPQTDFTCSDFYVDLQSCSQTDVLWDICSPQIPESLHGRFDSVICQATMEHVWDPATALENLFELLNTSGRLFIHTHTPCFFYHAWPRDYCRFWPDWFKDAEVRIPGAQLLEMLCVSGHAFVAYEKLGL